MNNSKVNKEIKAIKKKTGFAFDHCTNHSLSLYLSIYKKPRLKISNINKTRLQSYTTAYLSIIFELGLSEKLKGR